MNKIVLSSIVAVAGIASSAFAQNGYTFEMRLIADGDAGAPTGTWPQFSINAGGGSRADVAATRIGFWLQARVAQTVNQNWGIVRATSPSGGTAASFISVSDPAAASQLTRAQNNNPVDINNRIYGRGNGYRNGGESTGNTGNEAGSVPFPGATGNGNGGLDNGGGGSLSTRVYAFDAYVGSTRTAVIVDDAPTQPWGVNGATSGASIGNPVPSDGTFSPWANLYRVWIDITDFNTTRDVVVNASALLNGALQAAPTDASQGSWAMQIAVDQGAVMSASTTFHIEGIPTPGAAAVLGLGGLAAMRRRR